MSTEKISKEQPKKKRETLRESSYSLCPIHKVQYPRGATCPRCAKEQQ